MTTEREAVMQRARLWIAVASVLACGEAGAQMYKCKGPDGRIVYSDTKCEASHTGDSLKVTPMGTTKSEREKALEQAEADKAAADKQAAEKAAERKALAREIAEEMRGQGGTGAQAAPQQPYQLSASDRDRIRELEMTVDSQGAYPEQKAAAQVQISRIRRGADAKMSASDRAHRDSLMHDLVSTDKVKRERTLSEIRSKYY